jgi:two-component system, cell cycle response regulator DivK
MKRLLIIEDNADNMYLIRYMLQSQGYMVLEAHTGKDGVDMAISEWPDLILMDIQLPDIDGLEATRQIRASVVDDSIPIVALTSYALTGDRQRALDAGCSGYLEKPIDPEQFLNQIQIFLTASPDEKNSEHTDR